MYKVKILTIKNTYYTIDYNNQSKHLLSLSIYYYAHNIFAISHDYNYNVQRAYPIFLFLNLWLLFIISIGNIF